MSRQERPLYFSLGFSDKDLQGRGLVVNSEADRNGSATCDKRKSDLAVVSGQYSTTDSDRLLEKLCDQTPIDPSVKLNLAARDAAS